MKWTIRKKFLIGYFILFTLAAFLVQQIMKDSLEANSQALIESDMAKLQHTTREYSKQFVQIHSAQNNLITEYGSRIAQELSKLQKQSVALYGPDGSFIYETVPVDQPLLIENQVYQTNSQEADYPELKAAFANQASFTQQDTDKGTLIYFAYPLYIQDEFIGVLRFTADYTDLFERNESVVRSFTVLIISLFIGVFLISFVITTQITKPLTRLTKATKQVAERNYHTKVRVNSKDELAELAASFNEMQHHIEQHIERVEEEKDKVLLLEKTRTSFFNNVTHELKTPLATISGYAQIIGEPEFDDPDFLRKATEKIRMESERMNRMVIDLIELSKSESDIVRREQKPIHILPLVSSVCEDLSIKAKQQQTAINIEGKDFIVLGNQDELRQIFINVMDNAVKYGIPGTAIVVKLSATTVTVRNACQPVPEKIATHVFEPFIHTKGLGSSGLGLTISKQLTERHGGTISFEDQGGIVDVSIVFPQWQQDGNK
ncbi:MULTISPECIES: HAMP domain-containing sensor histidine kinase [unclassified Sporosarcina]|uniref:sensor histidine kinase n=1 Tax=unclassified Sporosarcina TaxID=2647733 RepID=UPI00203F575A|nr:MULTISPECIES: HAMP domain-containing sensor histidine kinase [unclassified Sporosarcina]GKV66195.1 sensor histidine kinase [Sporosarcina sp. NCCP-2331]GLB56197.1 sensor histidine kinase [Sporosarcina sp. NCCP-2378]